MAMYWRKVAFDRARGGFSGVMIAEDNQVGYWEEWVGHLRAVPPYGRVSHVLYLGIAVIGTR
jgi:hypothetical protein